MDDAERYGMQAVHDRLTRIEALSDNRDEKLARMEATLVSMTEKIERIGGDVRDAKTALRVGFWISTTLVPAIAAMTGWFAHTFWGGK